MAKYNPAFTTLYECDINYFSWLIQNELIECCSNIVLSTIIKDIKDCGYFSIMCDEARYYI